MDNLEKSLNEELKRFNQIGYNSINLEEQMLGSVGGGSGFMAKQGESDRVKKFESRQLEMSEQEDPEAPAEDEDVTSFAEMGVGDEDVEVDLESEIVAPDAVAPAADPAAPAPAADPAVPAEEPVTVPETPEETEDTTEVEVGDLIDKQETLEKNTEETNTKLDSLMSMLDGMEQKLAGMDQLMNQISSLEEKIENQRPKSEKNGFRTL